MSSIPKQPSEEQPPIPPQDIVPEVAESLTPLTELSSVARLRRILDDRDAAEAKQRALLDDPRLLRLIETGQLDTASGLAIARGTGTASTKLPRPKRSGSHWKPPSRRGGRSYPEKSGLDIAREISDAVPPLELTNEQIEKITIAQSALERILWHQQNIKIHKQNPDPRDRTRRRALLRAERIRRGISGNPNV